MIPTALYESYTKAMSENDRQANAAFAAIVAQFDPTDINGIRDALLVAYPALVKLYGRRAVQVAYEFYTNLRAEQRVTAWTVPEPYFDEEEVEELCIADVRREVGGLYSGGTSLDAFTSKMQGLATKRTMDLSDYTLHALANADPAKPKVALIPHVGACAWCILLAARGFTNTKKNMDYMRHDACKCTVVVDFDRKNPSLEGYDPHDYYKIYDEATRNAKFHEEWLAMSDEERAKYVRRTKDRTGQVSERPGDWSTYARNRTLQEMNVLLGNTKASRKGAAGSDGIVHHVDTSSIWNGRWGGTPKKPRTASTQDNTFKGGTDPELSKRAAKILGKTYKG